MLLASAFSTKKYKYISVMTFIITFSTGIYSQEKELEQLALTPKIAINYPLDYKILRPRLEYPLWDNDYDRYISYLTQH